jgi:hypothetical protein
MLENNPEDVVAVLFPNRWHTVNQKSFTFIKSCFPGKGKETAQKLPECGNWVASWTDVTTLDIQELRQTA